MARGIQDTKLVNKSSIDLDHKAQKIKATHFS